MSSSSRSMRDGRSDIAAERREPRRTDFGPLGWRRWARAGSISAPRGCRRARARRRRSRRSLADGFSACEIDFEGGFWMDYEFAARVRRARRASTTSRSRCTRRSPGFMGHAERGKKLNMAVGMLDHSAGIAKAAGAELVVFHPGFLLGRTREEAIDSVCEQLGELRERLEREGARRALRDRGDGPRARARLGRRRRRDRAAPRPGCGRCSTSPTCTRPPTAASPRSSRSPRRSRRVDAVLAAGRAVPHPLLRHPVREPQRDQAPPLRRGDAARRAARRGARARSRGPATVISESPDAGLDRARSARSSGHRMSACRSASGCSRRRPTASRPSSGETVADFCEPIDVIRSAYVGLIEITRDFEQPARAPRRRLRARRDGRRERGGRPRAAPRRRPLLRDDAGGDPGRRLQLPRAGRDRGLGGEGPARLLALAAARP